MALACSAAGFAVASIETHKTFLTGGRPPGKFATKPVRYELTALRRRLAGMHAGTWVALAAWLSIVTALRTPPRESAGLEPATSMPVTPLPSAVPSADMASLGIAAVAVLAATLVLRTLRPAKPAPRPARPAEEPAGVAAVSGTWSEAGATR